MIKKNYSAKRKKYRKFKNSKISHLFHKTLALSIICSKCGSKHERIFEIIKILKILG